MRGATRIEALYVHDDTGFNSRTPCGVRLLLLIIELRSVYVSIHGPRAGCDIAEGGGETRSKVSIHAPRAGCDWTDYCMSVDQRVFQFTHPVRGATRRIVYRARV